MFLFPPSKDDGFPTDTSRAQQDTEESVKHSLECLTTLQGLEIADLELNRARHVKFLNDGLESLGQGYACLDASRPWLCYWILHAMAILDSQPLPDMQSRTVRFLQKCQASTGGFCGGPGQHPHLAPTYAAVNALATIGTAEAFEAIDRQGLLRFLISMKHPSGGFTMHLGGEVDVRGSYCALAAAFIAGVLTPELTQGCAEYIQACQTYEGGLGGEPGNEAHGGYAFCGYAALIILGKEHMVDKRSMLRWAVGRQMSAEGGFSGRNNKLVDGCYSFWMGGLVPLLTKELAESTVVPVPPPSERGGGQDGEGEYPPHAAMDQASLQVYILGSCQEETGGGLRDKPSKRRDYYHTCYCLSGLSVAQHCRSDQPPMVVGKPGNEVVPVDAVLNIVRHRAAAAHQHFSKLPPVSLE